jgi:hypothetical protein
MLKGRDHLKNLDIVGRMILEIRMDLRVIGWKTVAWLHLAQDRVKWLTCEHNDVHSGFINGGEFLD